MAARTFTTPEFDVFAREWGIADSTLEAEVRRIEAGDKKGCLGGSAFKRRVLGEHVGSRDLRGVVAAVSQGGSHAVFFSGYDKGRKKDLTPREREAAKKMAKVYMKMSVNELEEDVDAELLREVCNNWRRT